MLCMPCIFDPDYITERIRSRKLLTLYGRKTTELFGCAICYGTETRTNQKWEFGELKDLGLDTHLWRVISMKELREIMDLKGLWVKYSWLAFLWASVEESVPQGSIGESNCVVNSEQDVILWFSDLCAYEWQTDQWYSTCYGFPTSRGYPRCCLEWCQFRKSHYLWTGWWEWWKQNPVGFWPDWKWPGGIIPKAALLLRVLLLNLIMPVEQIATPLTTAAQL